MRASAAALPNGRCLAVYQSLDPPPYPFWRIADIDATIELAAQQALQQGRAEAASGRGGDGWTVTLNPLQVKCAVFLRASYRPADLQSPVRDGQRALLDRIGGQFVDRHGLRGRRCRARAA